MDQVELIKKIKTEKGSYVPSEYQKREFKGMITGFGMVIIWMIVKLIIEPKPEWLEVVILCFVGIILAFGGIFLNNHFSKDIDEL